MRTRTVSPEGPQDSPFSFASRMYAYSSSFPHVITMSLMAAVPGFLCQLGVSSFSAVAVATNHRFCHIFLSFFFSRYLSRGPGRKTTVVVREMTLVL